MTPLEEAQQAIKNSKIALENFKKSTNRIISNYDKSINKKV